MINQPMSSTGPHTQASDIEITCKEVNRLNNELYDIYLYIQCKHFHELRKMLIEIFG